MDRSASVKPRLNICLTSNYEVVQITEKEVKLKSMNSHQVDDVMELNLALPDLSESIECKVVMCDSMKSLFDSGNSIVAKFINHKISDQLAIRNFIQTTLFENKARESARKTHQASGGIEARLARRVKVRNDVLLNTQFTAVDISETGLQIKALSYHHSGSIINLEFDLEGIKQEVKATVMWCKDDYLAHNSMYRMGLKFENITVQFQLLIRRYIVKQTADQKIDKTSVFSLKHAN